MKPSNSIRRESAENVGARVIAAMIARDMARKIRVIVGIMAIAVLSLLALGSTVPPEEYLCAPAVPLTVSADADRSSSFRQTAGRGWYKLREALGSSLDDDFACPADD